MIRRAALLTICSTLLAGFWPSTAAEFSFGPLTLTVPAGFSIERVAHSPLVDRPIMADLDAQGRLYVADSSGSNADVQTQLREKPHRIVRLEDTDNDGVYDSRVVFADRLMFPEGVLWANGSLYVAAPPEIWRLTDTDDDGICDHREVWHDGKTLTGCANDLHGPYEGRDGWIYWCKGAFAEQSYPRHDGSLFVSKAAHIFRKHPDGGLVEPVMTGGMDNPVELVFTPEGERFFTTTFLQHPGGGRRDGIIHAIYGGVYGKDHHVLEGHPRTGALMPVMTHHGPAASCALMRYESTQLGQTFQGNLFATLFNMRKVTRHELVPQGATFKTIDHDFLVGDHIDFHPTDVLEDHDGSLLVIDTGGWYKLCCPTSQLPKPEVLGAIYRIRRTDAPAIEDPAGKRSVEWSSLGFAELTRLLGDTRPAVRKRALQQLAKSGVFPQDALENITSTAVKQGLLWAATRNGTPSARQLLRRGLHDREAGVRQTALHGISVLRDRASAEAVASLLQDPSPSVQRAAAEAIGRIGSGKHVPLLLEALTEIEEPFDRVLQHSLRYALIEIEHDEALLDALESASKRHRSIALETLHQRHSKHLTPDRVFPYLRATDSSLRQTAWEILGEHPQWGDALAKSLPPASKLPPSAVPALAKLAGSAPTQAYLARQLVSPHNESAALDIIRQATPESVPSIWVAPLGDLLTKNPATRRSVIQILGRAKNAPIEDLPMLTQQALATENPPGDRLEMLALLTKSKSFPVTETLPFLLQHLEPTRDLTARRKALQILTQIKLDRTQLSTLIRCLDHIGPMELHALVTHLTERLKTDDGSLTALALDTLTRNPSLNSLPRATINQLLETAPPQAEASVVAFKEKLPPAAQSGPDSQRLETLMAALPTGDIIRGQAVFNSPGAACVTCHAMGYRGGTLGPDLTRIGQIRSRKDLLEAIIFPNASFVRSYETVLVTTADSQVHLGILKSENTDTLTLRTGPESETAIERASITEMLPGSISLMPPGIDTLLSKQQIADLLAFLENAKW